MGKDTADDNHILRLEVAGYKASGTVESKEIDCPIPVVSLKRGGNHRGHRIEYDHDIIPR